MSSLPLYALAGAILCSTALLCAPASIAQGFAPAIRIVDHIDESQLVTLKGNTQPAARSGNDRGRVSPFLPMTNLVLVLNRGQAQQAAFERFVAAQYDPASPDFHHWLSPQEVGQKFGPSETDIATISNWLMGHGFSLNEVTNDHMSIRFSGTAAQVESTFHTEIHNLDVKGVAHIGNMGDPQIPAALAPAVIGVKALHNFFPHPLNHVGSQVTLSGAAGKWQRNPAAGSAAANSSLGAATRNTGLHPEFGINVPASATTIPYLVEDVAPYDFATIYNILPLWTASTPIDGTGQTIAIAGTSNINPTDIASFRTFFGLPPNVPTVILGNGSDPGLCGTIGASVNCGLGDLFENSLDVEWSGAIAKGANIVLVTSAQTSATDDALYDSESYIVNNLTARIMNVSYGECELGLGTSGNVEYYNLWQTAAAEGIAVFAASGDSGSASCDQGGDANGTPYVAEYGLSVSGLSSTPYNTSVGGTDFNWCPMTTIYNAQVATSNPPECSPAPYWNASNSSASAGRSSALGYVPEVPWNNTCSSPLALGYLEDWAGNSTYFGVTGVKDAETACNFATYYYNGSLDFFYLVDTVGGSGGASSCVVNTTSPTGTNLGTCSTGATSTGSVTTPAGIVVGSIPLTKDGWQKPAWQTNPNIPNLPADGVRDIPDVSFFASNGTLSSSAYLVCISEASIDPECTYSTSSEPTAFEVGGTSVASPAMAGVMALINQKTGAAQGSPNAELYALAGQQTYSNCSAEKVAAGTAPKTCFFNDIDTGTNAMPCDYGANLGISPNCTATESIKDSTGTYADNVGIQTGYSAVTGYDMATGLGSLNIANVVNAWPTTVGTATANVMVSPAESSLFPNNTLKVTVTVQGANGSPQTSLGAIVPPTGSVTLSASGSTFTATGTLSVTGVSTFTIPAHELTAGTNTVLTVNYAGDVIYAPANGNATVQVKSGDAPVPTLTITPASNTVNSNAPLGVTVTVDEGSTLPQGTVTLTSGSYSNEVSTASGGVYSFTIPANSLPAGTNTLTATYSGDGSYGSASNTATVTVVESTFTLTPVVTPSSIAPGASAAASITVSSVAGYAGAVTLTCQQQSGPTSASDAPNCFVTSLSAGVNLSSSAPSGTITFSVSTTAPVTASLTYPNQGGKGRGWAGAGGGAILALLVFLGIPARRRSWRLMLGVLLLTAAMGSLTACGGGGGGGSSTTTPPPNTDPGTTKGTYVFLVQGTANPSVTPAVSTTFTVIVN